MPWTLVTGGAKRLGAELCVYLAERGLPVLVHYRKSAAEAEAVVKVCRKIGVEAESIQGDFSSLESIEDFVRRCRRQFPEIQNLINNVGNYLAKPLSDTTAAEWQDVFHTNLQAPFILSQAFISSLKQYQGNIVNIGMAGVGGMHADAKRGAYKIAKMGLLMLTRVLAKELAGDRIRVNMVSPGYLENAVDLPKDASVLPMLRPAGLEEVARVVWFLLEDKSNYITGQNIEVSGGVAL